MRIVTLPYRALTMWRHMAAPDQSRPVLAGLYVNFSTGRASVADGFMAGSVHVRLEAVQCDTRNVLISQDDMRILRATTRKGADIEMHYDGAQWTLRYAPKGASTTSERETSLAITPVDAVFPDLDMLFAKAPEPFTETGEVPALSSDLVFRMLSSLRESAENVGRSPSAPPPFLSFGFAGKHEATRLQIRQSIKDEPVLFDMILMPMQIPDWEPQAELAEVAS